MKKTFLLLLIALLLTIVLTSCGRGPSTAAASPAAGANPPAPAQTSAAIIQPSHEGELSPAVPLTAQAASDQASPTAFNLTSSAFSPDSEIPVRYSCSGEDISPPLAWGEPPSGTQSFAIIVDDPDAGGFTHWVLYNLSASTRSLPENMPKQAELTGGGVQGVSDFGKPGYGGPCPPRGTHHYHFQLYALDAMLNLPVQAKKADVLKAMEGHILAQASLIGLYTHR